MNDKELENTIQPPLNEDVSFETILSAWQSATDRLQETHRELRDEVRRLSDELELKNRELERQNRLADLGQMAAHVAHEIRNGLMPITLYLSQLERRLNGHTLHVETVRDLKLIDKIKSGLGDVELTINDLLHFAGDRPPEKHSTCLVDLTRAVCSSIEEQFAAHSIDVRFDCPDQAIAEIDPNMLRRCLLNLLLNAVDAMSEGGELDIKIEHAQQNYNISIIDTGPGIDEQTMQSLFDPFFTTKSEGTGLGLPIVEKIIHSHGGTIDVSNVEGKGAGFQLNLPIESGQRQSGSRSQASIENETENTDTKAA